MTTEWRIWRASAYGAVSDLQGIFEANPNANANGNGQTGCPLIEACHFGYDSIVPILLAHPGIDVNKKDSNGHTPLFRACYNGTTRCALFLLKDPRVDVKEQTANGETAFFRAAVEGFLPIVKTWIASGREIDLGKPGNEKTDVIAAAGRKKKLEVAGLLERFRENPESTRFEVRTELAWFDEVAALVFAYVIFVSDGLLEISQEQATTPISRFFAIARRLPLELQMVLCYRVVGSGKEGIRAEVTEAAFKALAKRLQDTKKGKK